MKDLEDQSSRGAAEPSPELLKELEVRPVLSGEMERVRRLLDDEHYLGAGRAVGRTLVQVVHHRGRWAALLVWGPAAVKLLDRDERVGWTHQQRAARLGLLVQNRRFLVLAGVRMPNLASRSLALAVRELPVQWEAAWGYRPLLAETFTDIEAFVGGGRQGSVLEFRISSTFRIFRPWTSRGLDLLAFLSIPILPTFLSTQFGRQERFLRVKT